MAKQKIIIIGGGISGLACAYKLAKTGNFEIHLYEKGEMLGGRLFNIFAGRVFLNEEFNPSVLWFTKEMGLMGELDTVTSADFGFLLPNKKIISGKMVPLYLFKEFIFKKRSLKLFSESFKFIRYIQSLKFNIGKYESNLPNQKELREMNFEEFRSNYSPEIQQFVIDPVQMMLSPENFKDIKAEFGLFFAWVIYAMEKGYFMSRAPKVYADAFLKIAKELNINIHLDTQVKSVKEENRKYKVIFSDDSFEEAEIAVCSCPLGESGRILNRNFGIEYSLMRGMLIKGHFRYKYPLILSAFPDSNVDIIYSWGEHQVIYPLYNELKPVSQNKTPVELNIDYLYKGDWEFIKELRSAEGIPLNLGKKIPDFKQGENLYICGDFYSYPGLESAVYTGLKVAEEIIKEQNNL